MASTVLTNSAKIPTTPSTTSAATSLPHHQTTAPLHSHSHRASFSSSAPQPLVTSSSSNLNAAASDAKMSQSQPSSQQSFSMSQPSASQGYRQYSDSQPRMGNGNAHVNDAPQIYSVSSKLEFRVSTR
jgi:hypothetical protein